MNHTKQNGNTAIGFLIIIASILFGVYVGGYLMFYGGIVQVIEAFQVTPIAAGSIAWGIIKVIFAGTGGVVVAALGVTFGIAVADR